MSSGVPFPPDEVPARQLSPFDFIVPRGQAHAYAGVGIRDVNRSDNHADLFPSETGLLECRGSGGEVRHDLLSIGKDDASDGPRGWKLLPGPGTFFNTFIAFKGKQS